MPPNVEFWKQQRFDRLTATSREPRIDWLDAPTGGIAWVRGQFIIGAQEAGILGLGATGRLTAPWLDPDLLLYRFEYPAPPADDKELLLQHVAGLRATLRGDPHHVASPRVALHYVLTGEPKATIPRGGSDDSPWTADAVATLSDWGQGRDFPFAAIVDTGVPSSAEYADHVFHRRTPQNSEPDDVDSLLVGPPDLLGSGAGHGGFIASLFQRLAGGGVTTRMVRALDVDCVGTEESVVTALAFLRANHPPSLVILSLGGFTEDGGWVEDQQQRDHDHPESLRDRPPLALDAELRRWRVESPDTLFVACAGNDGKVRKFWPAALAGEDGGADHPVFVAVASLDGDLEPSDFTNRGEWVTVGTLGENIVSEYPLGRFQLGPQVFEEFTRPFARWSGTSFAAPILAAEIARRAHEDPNNVVPALGAWGSLSAQLPPPAAPAAAAGRMVYDPREPAPYPEVDPRAQ
jgi:hypothetical protein